MNDGTTHKFKVEGLSVVDLDVSKIRATREVCLAIVAGGAPGTTIKGKIIW